MDVNISTFVGKYKELGPICRASINWKTGHLDKKKQQKQKQKKPCSLYYIPARDSMVPAGPTTWPLATCTEPNWNSTETGIKRGHFHHHAILRHVSVSFRYLSYQYA